MLKKVGHFSDEFRSNLGPRKAPTALSEISEAENNRIELSRRREKRDSGLFEIGRK